ncbi:MAG: TrmB family transcriptional regulator sugar-binding domain-containing protein, partial [Thermodesulfobacteriota bacterium]
RLSGIPRPNVYDALRSLREKGLVADLGESGFVPLPPEELLARLRHRYETKLSVLEDKLKAVSEPPSYDYVWTITGYQDVISKARQMIGSAEEEIYVLLYPEEGLLLDEHLRAAEARGVEVKYVSMGRPSSLFRRQVVHPGVDRIKEAQGGRVFDLIRDSQEILVGLFEFGREDRSPINWAKNHWFVTAIREYVRHDFFHYFLHKTYDLKQELTPEESELYALIKKDAWNERIGRRKADGP